MRISVKNGFKAQIPKRTNKTVVIQLGEQKRLKTLSLQKDLNSSRLNHTFNNSIEKQNLKSSRSIHKIKSKQKPMSLSKRSINSNNKSKQQDESISLKQTETIKTLQSMIQQLLESKKKPKQLQTINKLQLSTSSKTQYLIKQRQCQSLVIKKIVNDKCKKIQISLPFANLDLVEPQFWKVYQGQIKQDSKKHGHGTLYMTNGQKFTGKFQNNKATGNGTFYKNNGEVIIGVWKANKLVKRLY